MSKKKDSLKPWLSRPTINRSVTLPLTRPLTQRLSNLNEFHPNELDPYLLFDARDSMIGTLENPTLDLDPSKPDSLNVITATRAGVATFTDVNGLIASAPANTVRVDYVDSVPMILVEPSATNLLSYSKGFSHSSWLKTDVTISAAPVAAPDGTMTASHVVSTGSNAHLVRLGVPSGTHTNSIWARTSSGAGTCFFKPTGLGGVLTTVTDQWQRFEVPSNTHVYAVDFRGGSLDEIYIWGAQLETGSVSTSYIPTAGSTVTRAADDLVITGSAFSDFFNASEGTVYFEGTSNGISDPRLFEFSDGTTSNRTRIDINDGSKFRVLVVNGGIFLVNEESSFTGASSLFRAALSFKVNDLEGNLNGSSVINETPASLPTLDQLHVGSNHNGADGYLNGHIKRLIYWPYHSDSL